VDRQSLVLELAGRRDGWLVPLPRDADLGTVFELPDERDVAQLGAIRRWRIIGKVDDPQSYGLRIAGDEWAWLAAPAEESDADED
jgi:hypothetical protein